MTNPKRPESLDEAIEAVEDRAIEVSARAWRDHELNDERIRGLRDALTILRAERERRRGLVETASALNAAGLVSGGSHFHGRADCDPDEGKAGERISFDQCHAAGLPAGVCCGCATHLKREEPQQ